MRMTNGPDQIFRLILLIGTVILLPIMAFYRIRSQRTREKLDRRQEGWFILLTLRPLGIVHLAGLIVFLVDPSMMAWSSVSLPGWLRWSGVPLGAAGGTLFVWTVHTLGPNLTDTVVTRRNHTLVTTGPYRWVRHPFYCATALSVLANALVAANLFLFVTGVLTVVLIISRTRIEEARLQERFSDQYRAYAARTGRFIPKR